MVEVPQTETVVRAKGFYKRYKKWVAVENLDLTIQRGEIYGLIGPDGAGKSSIMKAVAGVLAFEQGELQVFNEKLDSEAAAERIKARIGFMPQGLGANLYAELSVEENIDFFAQLRLVPEDVLAERKQKLLEMTRLHKFRDRPMKHLSGGMKQKLGLVCTLIHQPELLILDEPTTGVDPVSRRDFWSILSELLQTQRMTALISTAYLDEATRFHHLAMMYQGRILASGEPESIQQEHPGTILAIETDNPAAVTARLIETFDQVEAVGNRIRVYLEGVSEAQAIAYFRQKVPDFTLTAYELEEPTLEDTFIALLKQQKEVRSSVNRITSSVSSAPVESATEMAIVAENLTRDFGDFRAVDHVSFQVAQGEIFGLLGANGAGKTTVIRMLTGILPPTSGEGRVAGANMYNAAQTIKERIGYMSQAFSLYQDLTVLENLQLYAQIYGVARKKRQIRIAELLAYAGLEKRTHSLVKSLPMGMRQRLALICALVHRPQVLFLDEPTSGVDPVGRRQFWQMLLHLAKEERVAILVTTHYMTEAEHCDRIALMYAGRVIANDSPLKMKSTLEQEAGRLIALRVDQPIKALQRIQKGGFEQAALFGNKIHLLTHDVEKTIQSIQQILDASGLTLQDYKQISPSLEDVFVYQISRQEKQESVG
ncbi:ATP-binding cassette domain-containing protein [Galenea microaerophila]